MNIAQEEHFDILARMKHVLENMEEREDLHEVPFELQALRDAYESSKERLPIRRIRFVAEIDVPAGWESEGFATLHNHLHDIVHKSDIEEVVTVTDDGSLAEVPDSIWDFVDEELSERGHRLLLKTCRDAATTALKEGQEGS